MINLGVAPAQKTEKFRPPEAASDPIDAFREAMAAHGLSPCEIEATGCLVRFDVDKKGDKAGWYALHLDSLPAGSFGSWKTNIKETWCSRDLRTATPEELAAHNAFIKRVRVEKEELLRQRQEKAKRIANKVWDRAQDAYTHPYLERKKVRSHFLRIDRGRLIVPMIDEAGEIASYQHIAPISPFREKEKLYLSGGLKQGCCFTIDGAPGPVYVCEGYATGASIHAATGNTVVVAFDSGNLPLVAKRIRKERPEAQLVIAADNDRFTAGNPGIEAAKKAAKETGAKIVWPEFDGIEGADGSDGSRPSDFNDLANFTSLEVVKAQIENFVPTEGRLPALTAAASAVAGRLLKRPPPLEFIFRFNGQGFIPKGVVGTLTATGGTGKTFFLLSLAFAGASGSNIGPISAPRPLRTLIILGEDTQDELDRRLWDIGKGKFPDNLHAASVYGELGALMRLDGGQPVLNDAWYWLDETLSGHPGLDLLIFDPMSRFYGLDENSNEHATQWIKCLERLAKKHEITILFSHHTGKQTGDDVSQKMGRGASAIIDGCRWQAGMARMKDKMAADLGLERARDYVVLDVPKSNYAPDLPSAIIFKRGDHGILEYVEPGLDHLEELADELFKQLRLDAEQYTKNELINEKKGLGITRDMKAAIPSFKRSYDMPRAIEHLLRTGRVTIEEVVGSRGSRQIINVTGVM